MSLPGREGAEAEAKAFKAKLLSDLKGLASYKSDNKSDLVNEFRSKINSNAADLLQFMEVRLPEDSKENLLDNLDSWLESNKECRKIEEVKLFHSSLKGLNEAITKAAKDLTATKNPVQFEEKNRKWSERIANFVMKAIGHLLAFFGRVSKSDPLEIFVDKIHIPAEQFYAASRSFIRAGRITDGQSMHVKHEEQEKQVTNEGAALSSLDHTVQKERPKVPHRRSPTRGHRTPGVLESESSSGAKVTTEKRVMADLQGALAARNAGKEKGK